VVVALSLVLVWWAYLRPPSLFEGLDWQEIHQPNRAYAAETLRRGHLPLWNPYVALGRPFLADTEAAVLYPPNLLDLLLDPAGALILLTFAHYVLGLAGTLLLGRALGMAPWIRWLVAVCFLWSAPLVSRLSAGQVPYVQALCYVPLLLLLALRLQDGLTARRIAALAVALALQLLCGNPQVAWITWVGLGAFMLGRALPPTERPLRAAATGIGGLAVSLAAGLALTGPMLLPLLEMASQANRTASLAFAATWGMAAWRWTSLTIPDGGRAVFGWEYNLYGGLLTAVAAPGVLSRLRDRNVRGLLLLGLAGAFLAAGTGTTAFAALHAVLPGLYAFRLHARAAVLTSLALLLCAGVFVSGKATRAGFMLLALGVAMAAAGPLLLAAGAPGFPAEGPGPALVRLLLALAVAALVLLVGRFADGRSALVARGALVVVVVVELGSSLAPAREAWYWPVATAGERPLYERLRAEGLFAGNGVPPRIAVTQALVRENAGLIYKWSSIAGYSGLTLARTWGFLHGALGIDPGLKNITFPSQRIYDRGPFPYDSMALVAGWDLRRRSLALRWDPDPRAYLATATRRVASWREAVAAIAAGHDFHREPLVEGDLALTGGPASGVPGRARIRSFAPEHIVVETTSEAPALLVLAEPWYPGWEAAVDGAPAVVVPANAWMRAVPLPAGSHRIEMRFHSRWLVPGAAVALAAAVALLLAANPRWLGPKGPASEGSSDRRSSDTPPEASSDGSRSARPGVYGPGGGSSAT
jgi:hypothetical protein